MSYRGRGEQARTRAIDRPALPSFGKVGVVIRMCVAEEAGRKERGRSSSVELETKETRRRRK